MTNVYGTFVYFLKHVISNHSPTAKIMNYLQLTSSMNLMNQVHRVDLLHAYDEIPLITLHEKFRLITESTKKHFASMLNGLSHIWENKESKLSILIMCR